MSKEEVFLLKNCPGLTFTDLRQPGQHYKNLAVDGHIQQFFLLAECGKTQDWPALIMKQPNSLGVKIPE